MVIFSKTESFFAAPNAIAVDNRIDRIDWIASDGALVALNHVGHAVLGDVATHCRGSAWANLWSHEAGNLIAAQLTAARRSGSTRFTAACDFGAKRSWWDIVLSPVAGGFIAQSRDISDSKALIAELQFRSQHDWLTGLLDRAALKNALGIAIERSTSSRRTGAVLMLDLDKFKLINDMLGHDVGDLTLQAVADGLRDVVGDNACARLGGDEFAVILSDVVDLAELRGIVERLLERLSQPVEINGRTLIPNASVGAALFPKHGTTPAEVLKHSDIALHAAKSFGRGGYALFVPSMAGPIRRRAATALAVRAAIADDRVNALYQPMINLLSGHTLAVEAKIQVHTADGRSMPREEIATVHEQVELVQELGERILAEVVSDARCWQSDGVPIARIAVNACAAEFRTGGYAERFLTRVQSAGLSPDLFELEISETALAGRGTDCLTTALKTLSAAGVRISLDDFGTGSASLLDLKRLPVDRIKIDGSFVEAMEHDVGNAAIVRAITGLATGFGIELAADGIGTPGQAQMLKLLGCTMGQGDLFGSAVPAANIAAMFASQQQL